MKTFVCSFALLTMSVAASAADSYRVTFHETATVAGQELKPGEYKLTVDGSKATIKAGKRSIEAPVKTETAESKFRATSVRYNNGDGKMTLREIHIGGSDKKIVFQTSEQAGL